MSDPHAPREDAAPPQVVVGQAAAAALAATWYAAWNRHDLEAVLALYHEDAVMISPVAARLLGCVDGAVRGKPALRSYWGAALQRFPDLRFTPIAVTCGLDGVVLVYRGRHGGKQSTVCETLMVGVDGLIVRGRSAYGVARP